MVAEEPFPRYLTKDDSFPPLRKGTGADDVADPPDRQQTLRGQICHRNREYYGSLEESIGWLLDSVTIPSRYDLPRSVSRSHFRDLLRAAPIASM
jgi:hypothetical protein